MPMLVDPDAPLVTPPARVVSPDGWFAATVDVTWAGVVLAVDYTAGTPLAGAANVRKVRILRTGPDGIAVPVRSADSAWAIGGVGRAYDHEAPLGVSVAYSARPEFADGSLGPVSSLAVIVPEPTGLADVWLKSVDVPGLSVLVVVREWPTLTWGARAQTAVARGNRFPAAALDVFGASTSQMVVDAEGSAIEAIRELALSAGVVLVQTRPGYHRPDQYVILGDVAEQLDGTPTLSRRFTVPVTEVARPATAGQPLRMPAWSYDVVAASFASYDAVAASYDSFADLATDGVG